MKLTNKNLPTATLIVLVLTIISNLIVTYSIISGKV